MARRLLVMSDCLEADSFEVTQEQLSLILDRHRNRISAAGIVLREMGLIEIARSQLRIINRKGLEVAACECSVAPASPQRYPIKDNHSLPITAAPFAVRL